MDLPHAVCSDEPYLRRHFQAIAEPAARTTFRRDGSLGAVASVPRAMFPLGLLAGQPAMTAACWRRVRVSSLRRLGMGDEAGAEEVALCSLQHDGAPVARGTFSPCGLHRLAGFGRRGTSDCSAVMIRTRRSVRDRRPARRRLWPNQLVGETRIQQRRCLGGSYWVCHAHKVTYALGLKSTDEYSDPRPSERRVSEAKDWSGIARAMMQLSRLDRRQAVSCLIILRHCRCHLPEDSCHAEQEQRQGNSPDQACCPYQEDRSSKADSG